MTNKNAHASSLSDTRTLRSRRGSVYLMALSTTLVIATLVGGTLYAQTQRVRGERLTADASKARVAAMSGIDVVRAWIAKDASWRSNRTSGRWASNLVLGDAKVDLDVIDTVDGNLASNPYDGVKITVTARVGGAEQIVSATLYAQGTPIDALAYGLHTGGQLHVKAGGTLQMGTATASTNGALRNDNTIEGSVLAASVSSAGTVFGGVTTSATPRAMPDAAAIDALAALGTVINTDKVQNNLSATSNPYGAKNGYGIYVVHASNDFKIQDATINGTLIIDVPSGKIVDVKGIVRITPTSSDFPALVVRGDLTLEPDAGQIDGLVHCTKTLDLEKPYTINGTVIAQSTASSDAVTVNNVNVINYKPSVLTRPPVGYAKRIDMVLTPGSYQRVVK